MKGLLCWLGMLSGSTTEPAASTRCLLCLFLGCQETGVGTEGQLGGGGGRQSPHGLVWWLYNLLFPGLWQLGASSSPSPAFIRQLLQDAAISRVQGEYLVPRLTWVLSSLQRGL